MRVRIFSFIILCVAFIFVPPLAAQQKAQYMPGQFGLNAGVLPDPGFTYANITMDYMTGTINDATGKGHKFPASLDLWVVENTFYYVFKDKVASGNFGIQASGGNVIRDRLEIRTSPRQQDAYAFQPRTPASPTYTTLVPVERTTSPIW
jgi:hypothetical protein